MKKLLSVLMLALSLCAAAVASTAGPSIPGDEVLKQLKDGNARYVAGQPTHPNQGADRRAETAKGGQHPVATVVGCSDSREPLELIFDQGLGDLFVIRVAGNVAGPDELGSIEYGVGHLGTPVVLVLGHTSCGAVTAAVQNAKVHGNIPALINQIKPAVAKAKAWSPGASGDDLVSKSIKANVWLTMENILRKSQEVREFVKDGKVLLVGGIYDLQSGQVAWLGQHPEQGKLLAAAPAEGHGAEKAKAKPKAKAGDKAEAKSDAAAEEQPAKPEPKASPKPAAKAAKPEPQPAAKPNVKSEGLGELLLPPDKPAGKPAHP